MTLREFSARDGGANLVDERVADPIHFYAVPGVEVDLEGEDTQAAFEPAADQVHAAGAPGPELRADEIDVSNAKALQSARKMQVKTGKVREDGERGLTPAGLTEQTTPGAVQGGHFLHDFEQADEGHLGIVNDGFDSGGAHLRAAHAKHSN